MNRKAVSNNALIYLSFMDSVGRLKYFQKIQPLVGWSAMTAKSKLKKGATNVDPMNLNLLKKYEKSMGWRRVEPVNIARRIAVFSSRVKVIYDHSCSQFTLRLE